jgi:hypothetical protein
VGDDGESAGRPAGCLLTRYWTEYFVNAPPACVSEFGPSAA